MPLTSGEDELTHMLISTIIGPCQAQKHSRTKQPSLCGIAVFASTFSAQRAPWPGALMQSFALSASQTDSSHC